MKARHTTWLSSLLLIARVTPSSSQQAPNLALSSQDWASALESADKLTASLNVTQKALLVTSNLRSACVGNIDGIPGSDFGGICLMDGPHGVRQASQVSLFPAGIAQAATWDVNLVYQAGLALGEEFRGKGAHVLLGPTVGPMGRHPLGGRNWEAFSPDPYLSGELAAEQVKGIQEKGVQACVKHLIANEQETQRTNSLSPDGTVVEGISSNIDDRTIHELYLWPLANAVRAGVASIMCGYNRLNQTYACENDKLLNGLVKEELGFQGYIVSDWFATHSGVPSMVGGLDMNMPGPLDSIDATSPEPHSFFGMNITAAISNGSLPESRLDDMVRRVLAPYYLLGQHKDFPSVDPTNRIVFASMIGLYDQAKSVFGVDPDTLPPARDVRGDHATLIRKIGAESIVLLKNTDNILPLQQPKNVGIFGNDAADVSEGFSFRADNYGGEFQYVFSNEMLARGDLHTIYPTPDVCLVFLKSFAREAADRTSFENDWNSTLVVGTVANRCNNTVVVTHSAGVNTYPWASHPNVKAILAAHYPGQESGNSIVDVLFGNVNPSGRLPYTIPRIESDYGFPIVNVTGDKANESSAWQANFTEGLLIDYRHFDARNITPLYEFGFGLSYTNFSLTAPLKIVRQTKNLGAFPPIANSTSMGGNPRLWDEIVALRTTVKNIGPVPGAQVVQLYMSMPSATTPLQTPERVLRGFQKIYLDVGESREVIFSLRPRDVSFWNVTRQDWQIPQGSVSFFAAFSSRNIIQSASVDLL